MTAGTAKDVRRLLVMRHAKSDWEGDAVRDFDRTLAPRGQRDAPRMGEWLREQDLIPDWLVCSPAVRAKETMVLVCQALGLPEDQVHWEANIYEANLQDLLAVLAECPPERELALLVGHNPGLGILIEYLANETNIRSPVKAFMPTAAIACITLPRDWRKLPKNSGQLDFIQRPKALLGEAEEE